MTTRPPAEPAGLAARGVRLLAAVVVALVVAAAGSVFGAGRALSLVVIAVLLAGAAVVARRRDLRGTSSSAAVAAGLVALLAAEELLSPTGRGVDVFLLVAGAVFVAGAYLLAERRLAVVGLLQWAVMLGRPLPGGPTFRHCVLLTDVAFGVPRLLPPLGLAVAAVAVGTWHRRTGRQAGVGRGIETFGAIGVATLLVALAVELPGHRAMCGPGNPVDDGWAWAALLVGAAMVLYGLAGRDMLWAATGVGAVGATGLLGTALAGSPWWAVAAALPLTAGLVLVERRGVAWPTAPGYGRASPTWKDLPR